MKRAEILEQARKCVCGEREREYGRPENNFALIGKLWEAYTGMRYSAKDVAMMLALLKVARIKTGVKGDSFVDLAGYAACAGEIATETPKAPPVNTCISCGAEIPEGRQVCPNCLGGDPHGERLMLGRSQGARPAESQGAGSKESRPHRVCDPAA